MVVRGVGLRSLGVTLCLIGVACHGDEFGPRDSGRTYVGQPLGGSGGFGVAPRGTGGGVLPPVGTGGGLSGDAGNSVQTGSGGTEIGAGGFSGMPGGGFNAGTDPQRNAVTPGTICNRLATIQCAAEAACCANPGRDAAACKQALMQSCTGDFMADIIAAQPVAGFSSPQAKIVLDRLEQLASQCDPTIVTFASAPEGLRSIFKGTFAPNAKCTPTNPLDKMMAAGALASCMQGESYACLPSTNGLGSWTCSARAAVGGRCFSDINCQQDLFCNNPNLDIKGSNCMMRKANATACAQPNECLSLFCKGGQCVAGDQQTAYCMQ